jgi:hypothetical protein
MDKLVAAASDFFAAILARFGFIGRPRRRAGIVEDLDLLERLRDTPEYGPESAAHTFLANHITVEVAKLAGIKTRRPIQWGSVFLAFAIGAPFIYWAYWLNRDGFSWLGLVPSIVGGMMVIAIFGLIFANDEPQDESDTPDGPSAAAGLESS